MRLKTFIAHDMTSAMAEVRRELGSDAIIVATTRSKNGDIEVRAAVDRPPPHGYVRIPDFARRAPPPGATIATALAYHAAPERLIHVLSQAADALEAVEPVAGLAQALEERFHFSGLAAIPARPLLLLGPPGCGKSATAAKIAARAALAGAEIDLVACDDIRAAAREQTRAYAQAIGADLIEATGPAGLARVMRARLEERVCLIDAPATNTFDLDELEAARALVQASGAEPVLVLDAMTNAADAGEIAGAFAALGCRRMLIAKADAAKRAGGVLAALDADLAFAGLAASPFVGAGIAPATPLRLARLLLDGVEEQAAAPVPRSRPGADT